MTFRRLHRLLGVTLAVLVVNAAMTGLLRANARGWYWTDRPARVTPGGLAAPDVSIEHAIGAFPPGRVQRVELRRLAGRPVYLIEGRLGQGRYALMDAQSGRTVSPISRDLAVEIARAFVPEQTAVADVAVAPAYRARKNQDAHPVLRVLFSDGARTEVAVDQESGQVVDVLDRGRRFGIWVARLHELDIAHAGRWALTALGVGVAALAVSGLGLALRGR